MQCDHSLKAAEKYFQVVLFVLRQSMIVSIV